MVVAFAELPMIGEEDGYLERRFGQVYLVYRSRVWEFLPLPRLHTG